MGVNKDAREEERTRYLIDTFQLRSTDFDDLLDVLLGGNQEKRIPGFMRLYGYDVAAIEVNIGMHFANNRRIQAAERQGLRIYQHQTTGKNKFDPQDGIYSMQGIFKQGLVDIPYKTEADQSKAHDFIKQLLLFPQTDYDLLMAFWFAETEIRKSYNRARAIRRIPQSRYGYFNRVQR